MTNVTEINTPLNNAATGEEKVPDAVRVVAAMIGATSVLEFAAICEEMAGFTKAQRDGKDADQLNYLQGYAEALEDAASQARMFAEGLVNAAR